MSAGYIVLYLVFLNNLSRFLKTMLCAYRKLLYELSQHPYIFVCVRRCDVSPVKEKKKNKKNISTIM